MLELYHAFMYICRYILQVYFITFSIELMDREANALTKKPKRYTAYAMAQIQALSIHSLHTSCKRSLREQFFIAML